MGTIVFNWISAADQAQGHSYESYRAKLKEYVSRNNYSVSKEFSVLDEAELDSALHDLVTYLGENGNKVIRLLSYKVLPWRVGPVEKCFIKRFDENSLDMVVIHHPCFDEPPQQDAAIWRYVSLPKFLDFLQSQSLFFARADKLRESDKFEGQYFTDVDRFIAGNIESAPEDFGYVQEGLTWRQLVESEKHVDRYNELHGLRSNFINCWHMAEYESIAMWKIYSDSFGVCIRSTFNRLCESIVDPTYSYYNPKNRIYMGSVKYIDRQDTQMPKDNMFWPYLHKSVGYSFERELRCVIQDSTLSEDGKSRDCIRVKVDAEKLVEKVYVNPASPNWYYANVEKLCEQYGVQAARVHLSGLT